MVWRQIASLGEALALKGTPMRLVIGGKEYIGKITRDYPAAGGMVFFEPDHPDPQEHNVYTGWVEPQQLQVQA